jgi:peptide deformylase
LAIRRILNGSSTVLRTPARPVKVVDETILRLLDDMAETMYDAPGVGLAAPQVGIAKQLIIADAGDACLLQLINPRIVSADGECVDLEGCLSLPGVFGEVPRAAQVVVAALDRAGREVRLEAEGLLARILQHEIDHLQGILFTDRAVRLVDPEELKKEEDR